MPRLGNPLRFNAAALFFGLPLSTARAIAARVSTEVASAAGSQRAPDVHGVAEAAAVRAGVGRELLDGHGHDVLRGALARELSAVANAELPSGESSRARPAGIRLSTTEVFELAAEIGATAHMLATVEWLDAGHRPANTPQVGVRTLEGALLIHLHAEPDSVPAELRAAIREEHSGLYKHRFMRPPNPSAEAMLHWARLLRESERSMYEYWQTRGSGGSGSGGSGSGGSAS